MSMHIQRSPDSFIVYVVFPFFFFFFSLSLLLVCTAVAGFASATAVAVCCHLLRAIQPSTKSLYSILFIFVGLSVYGCVRALSGRRVQDFSFKNSRLVTQRS